MLSVLKKINLEAGSLKNRLIGTIVGLGMFSIVCVTLVSVWQTRGALSDQANIKLEALSESKKNAIEDYSQTIVNQVLTLSSSEDVIKGMNRFSYAFNKYLSERRFLMDKDSQDSATEKLRAELASYYRNQFLVQYQESNSGRNLDINRLLNGLSPEAVALQHAYIQMNPAPLGSKHEMDSSSLSTTYDTAHEKLHPFMRQFLEAFGYYDIFLVDSKTGNVIYSVFKELDFATNLLTGPYANSGLAEAFVKGNQLTQANEYALIDYAQYTPSYESPASFISSPVFDRGKKIGVLVFQMPLDAISAVMNTRAGLGETGEAYLVGPDQFMRSDSYKSAETLSVEASFKGNHLATSDAIIAALDGQSGLIASENYRGDQVLSSYSPVDFAGLKWGLVVDVEKSEALAAVSSFVWHVIGLSALIAVGLGFLAMRIAGGIVRPIESMQSTMLAVSNTGDFSRRVSVAGNDEIGRSAESINLMLDRVGSTIDEVNCVVGGFVQGDFSRRVSSDVEGDLQRLKTGVNQSAESVEAIVGEVVEVVNAVAVGNFSYRVEADLSGDLDRLKQGVNSSAESISVAMSELGRLVDAMGNGDFKQKMNAELSGEYANFGKRVDSAMSNVDRALIDIDSVMSSIADGELDSRIESNLPGQLNQIKSNINGSLDTITRVFGGIGGILSALSSGNLQQLISEEYVGAFENLRADANATVEKLQKVVGDIRQSADGVRAGAEDISNGNNNLSRRTEQQAANLEQTAASMDEMTSTVKHTAENASRANELAIKAREEAERGGEVVNNAVSAMQEINESSNRIAEIISVIDEIAFQTNLLALNASVEAARAGEQGRGFAVVASEVRNLAGRSATAAKEIKELIEDSLSKVDAGSSLVSMSGETLEGIVASVQGVTNVVGEIATAADEQSIGINAAYQSIEQLQALTQQNTAMVEEAAAASEELGSEARGLNELVEFFHAGDSVKPNKPSEMAERRSASRPWSDTQPEVVESSAPAQVVNGGFEDDDWDEF